MSATPNDADLDALLEYLKRTRGFDFTGYKRASLARRIEKRVAAVDGDGGGSYLKYLDNHPEEFAALFNTILINVTHFFRDESAWEYLMEVVLPQYLAVLPATSEIRAWSAGCASGEEAYTLAMVLAEILGPEAFRARVKIYATDVDEEALARARQGTYSATEVKDIPAHLLDKYFENADGNFVFRKELRRQVIFGRHDLIQDAPISRVDLLVCRNTLMYFNADTQAKILARFHFALNDGGILFLGRAETLLTHARSFAPVDLRRRISVKVARAPVGVRELLAAVATPRSAGDGREPAAEQGADQRLREISIEAAPVAQIVVDAAGAVVIANERARSLFGLTPTDIGRPLQDLRFSYRPVDIRSLLDQVYSERRPVNLREIEFPIAAGDVRWMDIEIVPLAEDGRSPVGASISFVDITAARRLRVELEHASQELETAYEELQSTNEELETTNEELQSTVEELETTNEELQSTNEELEAMNQELQSTNGELASTNTELGVRGGELNEANAFLESVLTSLRAGVAVLDRDYVIRVWNRQAQEYWGLREDEAIGRHFLSLDIGLPVEQLKQPLKGCLNGSNNGTPVVLDAMNRRGRPMRCEVVCNRLFNASKEVRGVIVTMEAIDGRDPAPTR